MNRLLPLSSTALLAAALCLAAGPAEGAHGSVSNFALLDHQGKFHEFDYYGKADWVKGILLFVQGNGCPLVQKRVPELKRLRDDYQQRGVLFAMLNANLQDERGEIAAEAERFGIDMPVLIDESQLVAEMLGVRRTAEAFLIDARTKEIVFRGPIDDRMTYQKEKPEAEHLYLRDALEAFVGGNPVPQSDLEAPGCLVSLPGAEAAAHAAISYRETVAPLLRERCVACHREGGIGPFALSSYKKAKGWSDMMREMLLTRQMPPWQADSHHGRFSNDYSISEEERATLVHWIDAGCPKDDGADPLEEPLPAAPEWALGEPDHVIAIEEQSIPAEGVLDYRYVMVDLPFTEDAWISAVDVKPGNTRVLHHVIADIYGKVDGEWRIVTHLAGYAPGMGPAPCPPGTAIRVPAGTKVRFQLHYTTSGKEETDQTRLGLYTAKNPVEKELHTDVVLYPRFQIPAGAMEYGAVHDKTFDRDVLLYSMNPHMHLRGKAMRYEAHYPDGKVETLLSVPNYNFNWQRSYDLAEPKRIPAGAKLVVHAAWDNSPLNPHNPDPAKVIRWGEQSFDEMFFASYKFVDAN